MKLPLPLLPVIATLTPLLLLTACGASSDDDQELEHQFSDNYSISDFSLSADTDYWEIRTAIPETPEDYSTNRQVDEAAFISLSPVQTDVLNATFSESGFKTGCPNTCFNYVVSLSDDYATVISSYDELKAFFGNIDTDAELYIWLSESDYSLVVEPQSWEATATGYRAIITWDSLCAHRGTDLVDVTADGTITMVKRFEEKTDGSCF